MKTFLIAFSATLCLAMTAWAAPDNSGTDSSPTILADFETPGSLDLWTGLTHSQTDAHASSGKYGMVFSIPNYVEGQEERPRVVLPFANGKGFPFDDFSAYQAISVDAWVEGDSPGKVGIMLRDAQGDKSWTTHITVEPGTINHAVLPMKEAMADSDIHHVDEIWLYAVRPETAYTLVVDKVCLIPRDTPPLAQFDLVYPNYRGLIFPGAGDIEVTGIIAARENGLKPKGLQVVLSLDAGAQHNVEEYGVRSKSPYRIAVDDLPDGPVTLTASIVRKRGGQRLASKEWTLQKLTAAQRDVLKTYIDRDNTTMVDGKPFFPLGWYGGVNEEQMAEIADSPFNTLLAYGTDFAPKDKMLRFLDEMDARGLKLMYCMNDVYPTATYFDGKNWEGVEGNDAIAAAIIAAYRDNPAILGWYLNDELPHKLVPQLTEQYQRIIAADPNHPCFIVLCNRSELQYFPETTDIMGVDPYPIPKDPITRVSSFVDAAQEAVSAHKPVWLVPQAFGWYQYNSKNPDRGHTPSAEELRDGRAPTFEEERCMTYLGLVHGAKGLIYYCYYDLRVLPQYEEMWAGMKKIVAEVKELEPVLLSPDDLGEAELIPADASIHTSLKRCNGRLYLLAVNGERQPCHVTFKLKHKLPPEVAVMFENRTVTTQGKRLSADFAPLEVHVYDLGAQKR